MKYIVAGLFFVFGHMAAYAGEPFTTGPSNTIGGIHLRYKASLITGELTEFVALTNIANISLAEVRGSEVKYLTLHVVGAVPVIARMSKKKTAYIGHVPLAYYDPVKRQKTIEFDTEVGLELNENTHSARISLSFPDGRTLSTGVLSLQDLPK